MKDYQRIYKTALQTPWAQFRTLQPEAPPVLRRVWAFAARVCGAWPAGRTQPLRQAAGITRRSGRSQLDGRRGRSMAAPNACGPSGAPSPRRQGPHAGVAAVIAGQRFGYTRAELAFQAAARAALAVFLSGCSSPTTFSACSATECRERHMASKSAAGSWPGWTAADTAPAMA
jgi:hypothetical protein